MITNQTRTSFSSKDGWKLRALMFLAFLAMSQVTAYAQSISRDVTANNYDLSSLEPKQKVPLMTDESGTVLGIFRNDAKNGIVLMSSRGPLSEGAGLFFGSKDHKYPGTLSLGENLLIIAPNTYRELGTGNAVSDLYFEGIVQKPVTIHYMKDGKEEIYETVLIKPYAGEIGKLVIDGKPADLTDKDLTDAAIQTTDGQVYDVFFPSSVKGQWCYLVKRTSAQLSKGSQAADTPGDRPPARVAKASNGNDAETRSVLPDRSILLPCLVGLAALGFFVVVISVSRKKPSGNARS